MKISVRSPNQIQTALEIVREAEGAAGIGADLDAAPKKHMVVGKAAIALELFRNPMRRWGDQRFWPRCLQFLGTRNGGTPLLPPNIRSTMPGVQADLIYFKTHIRSFYCDRPVTLKLGDPARDTSSQRIRNEIAVRSNLTETARVRIPALKAHGAVDGTHFLVEEMIMDKPGDFDSQCPKALSEALLEFYLANGVELVPLKEALDIDVEIAALRQHAEEIGFDVPDDLIRFATEACKGSQGTFVLWGLRHGDLTPSNLLVNGDKIFIFDWEHAGRGMIFADLARLCIGNSALAEKLVETTRDWAAVHARAMMDPESQIAVGALSAINQRMEREPAGRVTGGSKGWMTSYRRKAVNYVALADRMMMMRLRRGRMGAFVPVFFDDFAKIVDDAAMLLDDVALYLDDILRYGRMLWPHLSDGKLF
ncbi:MAG: phosphotransferase [Rhodospirillaceae bacterium]|nr:phosphotransferase [Rhodospirillaceae bacterium]